MDAWRDGDTFHVEFDLPGVEPDSIDLDVERNVVTVKAERPARASDAELIAAERPRGVFSRQLVLGRQPRHRAHRGQLRRRGADAEDPGGRAGQAAQDRDQQQARTSRPSTPDPGGEAHAHDPGGPAGAARSVDEEFLDLVCADEELLRAEFDAIIAQEWSSSPLRQARRPCPPDLARARGTGCPAVARRPGLDHTTPAPAGGVGNARPRGLPTITPPDRRT